ncbi:neurocalcin homolog [Strongylocentrotus purpuratus]|uniref:EF-hand domain-containing protein n=1 Tax=Strongylocentrotus purpuratus TaxID=7668 RepID=A0A7M7N6B7_STRPU|nr:neurocalcin homolog [Strongylocentrotus purpuratus]
MCGMSTLMKGSASDKLSWIFNLFDVDGNGFISRVEMVEILKAIDGMIGEDTHRQSFHESTSSPEERTEIIFDRADENSDGMLSKEEFLDAARTDPAVMAMLQIAV